VQLDPVYEQRAGFVRATPQDHLSWCVGVLDGDSAEAMIQLWDVHA
jgi:hypothetical protein